MSNDLEQRIRALEDIEAIKRLKGRYCSYCDDNYDVEGLASLFTEDAIWDGGMLGKAVGIEKIRKFFTNSQKAMPFAVHMVMNPIIEVDGDRAEGTWYLFQAATSGPENRAVWGSARYDEKYLRVEGVWKFQHLQLTSFFWTPFDEGWVKSRFVVSGKRPS